MQASSSFYASKNGTPGSNQCQPGQQWLRPFMRFVEMLFAETSMELFVVCVQKMGRPAAIKVNLVNNGSGLSCVSLRCYLQKPSQSGFRKVSTIYQFSKSTWNPTQIKCPGFIPGQVVALWRGKRVPCAVAVARSNITHFGLRITE